MAGEDDLRISYLEECFGLLEPWEDVMKPTDSTHPDVRRFPAIEPVYFSFLAQMWLAKRKKNASRMSIGDAAKLVAGLSPSRAGRFVSDTIDYGYLIQETDIRDKRKKYVYLSPDTEERISAAVDKSIISFRKALGVQVTA